MAISTDGPSSGQGQRLFNGITFKCLHDNLIALARTTKLSKTATLSHYWQYAMLVELLAAAATARPHQYGDLVAQLPASRTRSSLSDRLFKLLEAAWNKVDVFTGKGSLRDPYHVQPPAHLSSGSGLSAELLDELGRFPLERRFVELKGEFFRRLEAAHDRIVLVLDGFDRLNADGAPNEALRLIFSSLVDAIQAIHADQHLPAGLEIKAFIPQDRYLAIALRDADKIETMHVHLRWNRLELKNFLKRRLELTPTIEGGAFLLLWRQVMPEHVLNPHYQLEEDSFEYLVRHTMMRPRQLQIHLECLAADNHDRIVTPSTVPKTISDSSKSVSRFFINEFRTEDPDLDTFVSSLSHSDNVLEYGAFRKTIESAIVKSHSKDEGHSVETKVDLLYAMGFFGIVNFVEAGAPIGDVYCPPTRESRRHYVDFFYKNPHPAISSTLKDDSVIGLHPILVDYANLRPHSTLIIG
jgi:hypothetical protein